MPSMATRKSRTAVKRVHSRREAKAAGQPSLATVLVGFAVFIAVFLKLLSYSTSHTMASAEASWQRHVDKEQQVSVEQQAATIRESLDGSRLDAAIRKAEGP